MIRIMQGDCIDVLRELPDESVQCCVTSPPYFGLRDYGMAEQIGAETTPSDYIAALVSVFREVRRVLRDDGTLWLNLGDSFSDKQLQMIPARVALALQADGWWLRSDIIWHKPNPMPESITDRPTSAHEHVFLLTKSPRYFYDADAVREEVALSDLRVNGSSASALARISGGLSVGQAAHCGTPQSGRNIRNVWTIATAPYAGAHFATFPPELAERCIKAGSRHGDTILDPFAGAFTAPMVADRLQRHAIGIELSPAYCDLARARITKDAGMFAEMVG